MRRAAALEGHSLASGFTPPLIAFVNAPPHAEAELRAAWMMGVHVARATSGQRCFSSDEINEQWLQIFG